ncbi:MAG: hypothetical protein M0Z48_00435 [Nitrospiraceae bacterium]|nr:hypothetical protein [Nitrospiraceae bacterium]
MGQVSETILQHVYQSLSGLTDGQVKSKADELAGYYGVHLATVYRWASLGGLRWRKQKASKGRSKVPESALMQAGALLYSSRRVSNEIPLPGCDAVEILADSGLLNVDVSTGRFLGIMRQKQISAQDILRPSPHQTLLSKHPNHVWQFDVTNCLQYFLDTRGMGERDQEMELYKNKIVKTAKTIKKELLRYVAVDHCTGAFYFRYFYASGERAIDGSQFLFEAMRPKDELLEKYFPEPLAKSRAGKYRMHGVPFILIPDKGSIIVDKANKHLFESLRMEVIPHMPGNPRAKGAVEGMMHFINRFESRLKFKRPRELDELNRWALDWCVKINAINLMRGVAPRSAMWSRIKPEELRLCPEEQVYRLLIRKPIITPTANGACIISVLGGRYKIPHSGAAHRQVEVAIYPYEYGRDGSIEAHFDGQVYLLKPIPRDDYGRLSQGTVYGEYHTPKETATQKAKKEFEKIGAEWGLTFKGTGDKRRANAPAVDFESPLQVFGHQADKVPNIAFMNPKGSELEIKRPDGPMNEAIKTQGPIEADRGIVNRRIPIMEFLMRLRSELGSLTAAMNTRIRSEFGESIEIKKAEEVIEGIKAATWPAAEDADAPDARREAI